MKTLTVHTDGGARGNPGPAAIGVVVYDDSKNIVTQLAECIGDATNNVAEYTAVKRALEILIETLDDTKAYSVVNKLDSQLVERQLKGEYKVKDETLAEYAAAIKDLIMHFNDVTFVHVPRSENKAADTLVNEALDKAA